MVTLLPGELSFFKSLMLGEETSPTPYPAKCKDFSQKLFNNYLTLFPAASKAGMHSILKSCLHMQESLS